MKIRIKKISLIFTAITLSLFLISCEDNPLGNETKPPCFECFDFRLTDYEAAWSPDGKTIAYIHGDSVSSKTGIYLIDTNGANNRILYISNGAHSPSWSPNGEWLVFSDKAQIYKIKSNGDSLIQLTSEGRNYFPSWSPDGKWIAYDSNKDSPNGMNFIWKMKSDGSEKTRIAYEPEKGEIREPSWSPDGSKIVHIRYSKDFNTEASEIVVMNENGNNVKRLTFNDGMDDFPKYSPDGNNIAYTYQPNGGTPQIWVMNSDGTNQKQLTETQGYGCDWSPDGEWIIYTDSRAISGRLWIMKRNGKNKHQITFN